MTDPREVVMTLASGLLVDPNVPTAGLSVKALTPMLGLLLGAGWEPDQVLRAARECRVLTVRSLEYQLVRLKQETVHRERLYPDPTPRTPPDKAKEWINRIRREALHGAVSECDPEAGEQPGLQSGEVEGDEHTPDGGVHE